jgi:hypothetical protein
MDRFESHLRQALRDQHPDAGFAERVIAVASSHRKRHVTRVSLWAVAVFATLFVSVAVVSAFHAASEKRQRMMAERAKQDVLVALRITREKLQTVEDRLAETAH